MTLNSLEDIQDYDYTSSLIELIGYHTRIFNRDIKRQLRCITKFETEKDYIDYLECRYIYFSKKFKSRECRVK